MEIWQRAISILNSMYYSQPGSSKKHITPSLRNWIFTIKSFQYLWQNLKQKGFRYLAPRALNQDPLENFFSLVRSHGDRNVNPTCFAFASSIKSLTLNNFVSSHSINANCEQDETDGLLDTLKEFITHSDAKFFLSNKVLPTEIRVITAKQFPIVSGFCILIFKIL